MSVITMDSQGMGGGIQVSANDRLGFTIFIAIAVHLTIVFGISFQAEPRGAAPLTVEVTLAQYDDKEEPEDADFIAQTNQKGSGTALEKTQLTTTERADFRDTVARKVTNNQPQDIAPQKQSQKQEVITSNTPVSRRTETQKVEKEQKQKGEKNKRSLMQNALEIASLEAKRDRQKREYAKRPRVTRLTSVSAKASASAHYMDNWVRKVERVGNLNYPKAARQQNLSGKVRVAVLLGDNGEIENIDILASSGSKILDDAVVRILRLAEPFGAFTDSMREEADKFEIIRTFDFRENVSSF